jgi:hypothetical protein
MPRPEKIVFYSAFGHTCHVFNFPSCRWSKYFVIVGLPTNNLVVAEGQGISGLEAEFDEH